MNFSSWTCQNEFSFDDKNFSKIFRFFVIETPIETASVRSISFDKRNINKTALNKKIKWISSELKDNWNPIFEDKEIADSDITIDAVKGLGMLGKHNNHFTEFACFITRKSAETETFFYCIRCAFAHGSFCIHNKGNVKYYYFENIHSHNCIDTIIGRAILKEETLLRIIQYCESKNKEE